MNRFLSISLLVLLIALTGCASKRLVKRGLKFEQAGMYEMAADFFYQAIKANANNVDAAIGLKKNAQRVLDDKVMSVQKAYFASNDKETVYSYLDAKQYLDKIQATGVTLTSSNTAVGYFEEAKPRYLESLFYDARLLLDEEKFKESEAKFAEIKRIEPNYQGVDEHMKVSRAEPIYREGLGFLNSGLNRKAYYSFNGLITNHGLYKDAKDLRDEALAKAIITIGMGKIENKTRMSNANTLVESIVSSSLSNIKDPFIKIIDTKNTDQLLNQQRQSANLGSNVQVGQMLTARALLNGSVIRFEESEGKTETKSMRGYLKEVIVHKDKTTGEEKRENKYHKVSYTVTSKSNAAGVTLQYQLTSTETGAVLVSDVVAVSKNDQIEYASYTGDSKSLVPGYWEFKDKESNKDRVDDNFSDVRSLQSLLGAQRNIKSAETLLSEALSEMATRVTNKVAKFNPEQ